MAPWDDEILRGRNAIIRHVLQTGRMPSPQALADTLTISGDEAHALLHRLHEAHAVLLDSQGNIRMLSPFSGVPTPFEVTVGSQTYWANCAWDCVGIPAALHADDAVIHAHFAYPPGETTVTVQGGRVTPGDYLVHFPHPVRQWYDDLVYT